MFLGEVWRAYTLSLSQWSCTREKVSRCIPLGWSASELWSKITQIMVYRGTDESTLGKESSVPLMQHDPNNLRSLILIHIIPKKRTLKAKPPVRQMMLRFISKLSSLCTIKIPAQYVCARQSLYNGNVKILASLLTKFKEINQIFF